MRRYIRLPVLIAIATILAGCGVTLVADRIGPDLAWTLIFALLVIGGGGIGYTGAAPKSRD